MVIKGLHVELRGQRMRTERIIDVMRDAARWGYTHVMLEYCDKFPYTRLLKDQGFQVIVAPAARSGGDTFFAPKSCSVDNCIAAAKNAHRSRTLGMVVASWALRTTAAPLPNKH